MNEIDEFIEGQKHIYDKGYWAGKMHPFISHKRGPKILAWVSLFIFLAVIIFSFIGGR